MVVANRSVVTAILSLVAALAIALTVYGRGCESEDRAQVIATRFLRASAAGDRDSMWALLSRESRESLAGAARRATELVGGARRYRAREMLVPGPSAPESIQTEPAIVARTVDRVEFQLGAKSLLKAKTLVLVREGEQWRVRLEIDAMPDARQSPR